MINRHLREGDKVRLKDFGLMKLEIESDKVDNPRSFRASKHIRGVRLHFIPESVEGTQSLYAGITFEKDKTVYAEAQVPTALGWSLSKAPVVFCRNPPKTLKKIKITSYEVYLRNIVVSLYANNLKQ